MTSDIESRIEELLDSDGSVKRPFEFSKVTKGKVHTLSQSYSDISDKLQRQGLPAHFFAALDVYVGDNDAWLIEVNGSNALASSIPYYGDDGERGRHMGKALLRAINSDPTLIRGAVALVPYRTKGFVGKLEYQSRIDAFCKYITEKSGVQTNCMRPNESTSSAKLNVVISGLKDLANNIAISNDELIFLDSTNEEKPIIFATNPNLLMEIERQHGSSNIATIRDSWAPSIYHDGAVLSLIHAKGIQQDLCDKSVFPYLEKTGFTRLKHGMAHDNNEFMTLCCNLSDNGSKPIVPKMHGGSGGAGVCIIPRNDTKKGYKKILLQYLELIEKDIKESYGELSQLYPLRVFECAESSKYIKASSNHLWDLRIVVVGDGSKLSAYPSCIRVEANQFDPNYADWKSGITNRTGQTDKDPLDSVKNPGAPDGFPHLLIDEQRVQELLEASCKWVRNALVYTLHRTFQGN